MNPTQILSDEHRIIEIVLSTLERITEEALQINRLDRESAEQAIDFIRNFADGCHHYKEENLLFVTLIEKGLPQQGGPVGQMLVEHEQGRQFVAGMARNVEAASSGDAGAVREFAQNAGGYVQLLRAHILKEDNVLFRMAGRILDDEDRCKLMQSFSETETHHMGEGTHARYLGLAANLAKKYGVPHELLHNASCGCSH